MFEFIGGIFSFALGMVKMGISLAWGGIFSLIMSLGGFFLAGALVLLAFTRRRDRKRRHAQPYAEDNGEDKVYDVDKEEFTSFYDQFRTQE